MRRRRRVVDVHAVELVGVTFVCATDTTRRDTISKISAVENEPTTYVGVSFAVAAAEALVRFLGDRRGVIGAATFVSGARCLGEPTGALFG